MEQARVAVLVGIDNYDSYAPLRGCVADALAVAEVLATHHDGTRNFNCQTLTSDVTRIEPRQP